MALEDAVTLGAALRASDNAIESVLQRYAPSRAAGTARIALMARETVRIYHAQSVEWLVRNDLWKGRAPERFYDAFGGSAAGRWPVASPMECAPRLRTRPCSRFKPQCAPPP
jgi:2-polyprenyl-6-methoxyphenol hydroxylase-like FAD-dependent oxidoreductase